jgi:carboxypeptidase D
MPGGCKEQGDNCRILQARGDPNNYANNSTVATACSSAVDACQTVAGLSYNLGLERSTYDIADLLPITFPPPYATGYLNNDWVQTALGAKVNFTESSTVVNHSNATPDLLHPCLVTMD